jgi:hypothetical protein
MPVRRMTSEEREQLFGDGVIILGGHIPRADETSSDDKRHESPKNYEDKLPLGNKNE